jgi:hypothetical protein
LAPGRSYSRSNRFPVGGSFSRPMPHAPHMLHDDIKRWTSLRMSLMSSCLKLCAPGDRRKEARQEKGGQCERREFSVQNSLNRTRVHETRAAGASMHVNSHRRTRAHLRRQAPPLRQSAKQHTNTPHDTPSNCFGQSCVCVCTCMLSSVVRRSVCTAASAAGDLRSLGCGRYYTTTITHAHAHDQTCGALACSFCHSPAQAWIPRAFPSSCIYD